MDIFDRFTSKSIQLHPNDNTNNISYLDVLLHNQMYQILDRAFKLI